MDKQNPKNCCLAPFDDAFQGGLDKVCKMVGVAR